MSQKNNRLHQSNPDTTPVAKPNTLSLLSHIVRATVLNGMRWPVILCAVLVYSLYYFNVAHHDSMTILIITGIILIGLVRGCNAWQNDLNEYQRQLAMARHQQPTTENSDTIPGYYPSRRY